MLRTALIYGIVAGMIVAVPFFPMLMLQSMSHMMDSLLVGYGIMLIALSTIFVAIKRRRDVDGGGTIRFWNAFALGLCISVIAGVIYVLGWDAALAVSHTDFAGDYAKTAIAAQRAKGVSGAQLQQFVAEMDAWRAQYANPLYRWPMTFAEIFPVGVIVSLISAALLRNARFLPARRAA